MLAAYKLDIEIKRSFRHGNNCNWSHQIPKPLYQIKITIKTTISLVKSTKNTKLSS